MLSNRYLSTLLLPIRESLVSALTLPDGIRDVAGRRAPGSDCPGSRNDGFRDQRPAAGAVRECIVEPRWLISPLTLADQQVGISEPGAAPSESQRCSGRRHPGGDSKRERSGLAIRSVASDE